MKPSDFLPHRIRQAKEFTEQGLDTILEGSVEFSGTQTFGKTAMLLCASPFARELAEGDNNGFDLENFGQAPFVVRDLAAFNQDVVECHRAGTTLPDPERGTISEVFKKADLVYSAAAIAAKEIRDAQAEKRMPAIFDTVGIRHDLDASTGSWMKQKAAVASFRKRFKKDPNQLYDDMAAVALDMDLQMTQANVNAILTNAGRAVSHLPLGKRDHFTARVQQWMHVSVNLQLRNDGQPVVGNVQPIQKLAVSKAIINCMAAMYEDLLADKSVRSSLKRNNEKSTLKWIEKQIEIMHKMTANTIGRFPEMYDAQTQKSYAKSFAEVMLEDAEILRAPLPASIEKPASEKIEEIPAEPEVDEWYLDPVTEIIGLTALADSVRVEHKDVRQAWDMSRNLLKKLGLLGLIRELQSNHDDWIGRIDSESYSVARSLVRLQEYAERGGMPALASLFEKENFLWRQLEVAQAGLHEINRENPSHKTTLPGNLETVYADFEKVRGNWDALWPLILEFWPDEQGAEVVDRLERLFGLMPAKPYEAVPEEPVINVVEKAAEEVLDLTVHEPEAEPFIDPELVGIADAQLDILAFPNTEAGFRDLMKDVRNHIPEAEHDEIEWWRLKLLHRIKAETGGTLYRTRPGSFGHRLPWYALHFEISGVSLALLEHPVEGNATYLIRDEYDGFWQDLVSEYNRNAARMFGQKQIIHPDRAQSDRTERHYTNLRNHITDSLTVKV